MTIRYPGHFFGVRLTPIRHWRVYIICSILSMMARHSQRVCRITATSSLVSYVLATMARRTPPSSLSDWLSKLAISQPSIYIVYATLHECTGTIKDIVTRYATQTGHYVSRRFGWDCHGLPVEYEIDKKLDIKGRDQVLAMGIDKYNAECRSIVTRYCKEWEVIVGRMGRWIDFKNDYKTMVRVESCKTGVHANLVLAIHVALVRSELCCRRSAKPTPQLLQEPWYMESVWWVFKTLWEKVGTAFVLCALYVV